VRALPVLALLVASGCCSDAWSAFPMSVMPDRSCSTGEVHGYDVYIWDCLEGEHIVVAKYSSEMACRSPVRERAPCGAATPLEAELKLTPAMCRGPRYGQAWRVR
jgi:hypothetical protein